MLDKLLQKSETMDFSVIVLGLRRVGLPLSTVLANKGIDVYGFDISTERIDSINNKTCPFYDPNLQESLESAIKKEKFHNYKKINKSAT